VSAVITSFAVRFAHCDAAGIAYFPRLLELADMAVEEWTQATLESRAQMHGPLGYGLPTVALSSRFLHPCRMGERLDVAVRAEEVGERSVGLAITATVAEQLRFTVRSRVVLVSLDTMRPTPWPPAWRERLLAQCGAPVA
jgi:4-hydroxybenzoyl-CoA thioesterase